MFNIFNKVNLGFWGSLKKPFFVLAPMAEVTDVAFRQMFARYGKPDVLWTEFVSADGLVKASSKKISNNKISSQEKLWRDLIYFENERPIVAQLFSSNPKMMEKATYLVVKAGFDGIDINMGCPEKSIQKQKSGASLIKDYKLAVKIIKATKRGIKKACKELKKELVPLSIKTRIGYNKDQMEEWLTILLKEKPAVITLHARTKKDLSKTPAKWNRIKDAVKIRNKMKSQTSIIGNGDLKNLEEAKKRVDETNCDGVMIGRGAFGNPWLFNKILDGGKKITLKNKLEILLEHTKLFEKYLSHKNFNIMKKHFKAYTSGFKGVKGLREKLMKTKNANEMEKVIKFWISENLT